MANKVSKKITKKSSKKPYLYFAIAEKGTTPHVFLGISPERAAALIALEICEHIKAGLLKKKGYKFLLNSKFYEECGQSALLAILRDK